MSITQVSSTSNNSYSPMNDNSVIKILERQKEQLQDQIKKVNESKMDAKLKQEKVKELNDQITQIDAQIRQLQSEKFKPDTEKMDSKNDNSNQYKNDSNQTGKSNGSANPEYMVSAASAYSDLKAMGKVRTELQNQFRSATRSGEDPKAGKGIKDKLEKLEGKMMEKSEKINDDLKKAAEEGAKTDSQETKDVTVKGNKAEEGNIENVDNQNTLSAVNGDIEALKGEAEDKSLNEDKTSEKALKNKKNEDLVPGKVVDIRI